MNQRQLLLLGGGGEFARVFVFADGVLWVHQMPTCFSVYAFLRAPTINESIAFESRRVLVSAMPADLLGALLLAVLRFRFSTVLASSAEELAFSFGGLNFALVYPSKLASDKRLGLRRPASV